MNFNGFTNNDFDVFNVEGLDQRMEAIQEKIRPKLEYLGMHFAPMLSLQTNEEFFYHVAKHARRTVNPPKDTWVAFASNKRGYKKHPHFQIGLFESHLFVWFAVIYESPIKKNFAKLLNEHVSNIQTQIPDHFVWSSDHTKPGAFPHQQIKNDDLTEMFQRLASINKAEILCGIHLDRSNPIVNNGEQLLQTIVDSFKTLLPLYHLAKQSY